LAESKHERPLPLAAKSTSKHIVHDLLNIQE
jgi:hypothetical protein